MAESVNKALPKSVFDVDVPNGQLLKTAYDSYLANSRLSSATTKQRGEVRGGGKKPWRQKGTGRARHGSNRSPIWVGGGVTFGPRGNENYSKKLSTSAKRQAVRQALTLASRDSQVVVVDELNFTGKTKDAIKLLGDNKINENDSVLLVTDDKSDNQVRSTANISRVKLVKSTYLNVFDVLNSDKIIVTQAALASIENWLTGGKK